MQVVEFNDTIFSKILEEIQEKQQNHSRIIVAIAGGSATGKSSQVTQRILDKIENLTLIPQDTFQIGRAIENELDPKYKWDDPKNFALEECKLALQNIRTKDIVTVPNFNVLTASREGTYEINVQGKNTIVFEGLYSLHESLSPLIDYKIYVEAQFYCRFIRRIFRFTEEMKIPRPDTAVKQVINKVNPAHIRFVQPQRVCADIVIQMPFTFEETYTKYNLESKRLEAPIGEIIYETQPVEQLIFRVTKDNIYVFSISYKGQIVFKAPIEEETINNLRQTDLFSY